MWKNVEYSLAYSKSGIAVYLSHLDTLRILERALRRTGMGLCFTQGLNPHIRLSHQRAVPVGIETGGEWFSIKLKEALDPEQLMTRVNHQLPQGFSIVKCCQGKPPQDELKPMGLELLHSGTRSGGEAAASKLMSRNKIEVESRRKGKEDLSDVRPYLKGYETRDDRILFFFEDQGEKAPRISDLARALYAMSREEGLDPSVLKIVYCSRGGR